MTGVQAVTEIDAYDRQLVRRMLRGDDTAFDTFVDDLYPRLFRFAVRRLAGDRDAAQEVVQNVFEKAIPRLGSYRGEAGLFTWLCGFCRFELAAYWRQHQRLRPEVQLAEDDPEVQATLESLASGEEGPHETLQRAELAHTVRIVLDHLPVRYGNALEWKYLNELSVNEIAARLAISPKATESLLTRARQAFRDGFAALTAKEATP